MSISDCLHLTLDLVIALAKFYLVLSLLYWRHTYPSLLSFMTALFESFLQQSLVMSFLCDIDLFALLLGQKTHS